MGLNSPRPQAPFTKLSFNVVCARLRSTKSPGWAVQDMSYNSSLAACNLKTTVVEIVNGTAVSETGLDLTAAKSGRFVHGLGADRGGLMPIARKRTYPY
jgi:hypothetical protein